MSGKLTKSNINKEDNLANQRFRLEVVDHNLSPIPSGESAFTIPPGESAFTIES